MVTKKIKIEEYGLYPDGKGGQLGDRGYINDAKILEVKNDGTIILDKDIDLSKPLNVKIDDERRFEIARNHTGQHILSQAIIEVCNAKTLSFHMGEDYSTIDIEKKLNDNEVKDVEELANDVVSKALKVKKYFINRSELSSLGLRKISDVKDDKIRIVEIENFDKSMCAGFHVDKTSEVMLIKILKQDRVKGGLNRLYFVCGKTALNDYRKKNDVYNEIISMLSSQEPIKALRQKLNDLKQTQKKLNSLSKEFLRLKAKEIYDNAEDFSGVKFAVENMNTDQGSMRFLVQNILNIGKITLIVYNDDYFVIGSNVIELKKVDLGLKGGGTNSIFMGKNEERNSKWIQEILENLKSYI